MARKAKPKVSIPEAARLMTDEELVALAEQTCERIANLLGYETQPDNDGKSTPYHRSRNSRRQQIWGIVVVAFEELLQTPLDDAVDNLEEPEQEETTRPPLGVHVNAETKQYKAQLGSHVDVISFDQCLHKSLAMLGWLQALEAECPDEHPELLSGTPAGYRFYQMLLASCQNECDDRGIRCSLDLESKLQTCEGQHVEVVDCNGETRQFWVGKSTGWMPAHLELSSPNAPDGTPVSGRPLKSVKVLNRRRIRR